MSRLTATIGTLSLLLAIPSCSLLIDTHPDGVRDAGSGATSGEARANVSGAASLPPPSWAGAASMSAGSGAGSGGTPLTSSTWSGGGLGGVGSSGAATAAGASSAGASQSEIVFPAGGVGGGPWSSIAGNANVAGTTAGGASTLACGEGETPCAGTCVNTKSNKANCGACGTPCEGYQFCADGKCVPTYVSTRVQPATSVSVLGASVAANKAQGDLTINVQGESMTFSAPGDSITTSISGTVGLARYSADGILVWGRAIGAILTNVDGLKVGPMVTNASGDIAISYVRYDAPSDPRGSGTRTLRMAKINGFNANPIWDAVLPTDMDEPRINIFRKGKGDYLSFGKEPNVLDWGATGAVAQITDSGTSASTRFLQTWYGEGAVPGADGSTVWTWGSFEGTWPLNPWSTQTWTVPGNPNPGAYMRPDVYILGAQDDGQTVGPWFTEGDSGPRLMMIVDEGGDLVVAARTYGYTTFNGGQDVSTSAANVLFKVDHRNGKVLWRVALGGIPGNLTIVPGNRIALTFGDSSIAPDVPVVVSFFSGVDGSLLSSITAGSRSFSTDAPVLAAGQTDLFVIGNTDTVADFDPGDATDLHGATPGVFISRYSF